MEQKNQGVEIFGQFVVGGVGVVFLYVCDYYTMLKPNSKLIKF